MKKYCLFRFKSGASLKKGKGSLKKAQAWQFGNYRKTVSLPQCIRCGGERRETKPHTTVTSTARQNIRSLHPWGDNGENIIAWKQEIMERAIRGRPASAIWR